MNDANGFYRIHYFYHSILCTKEVNGVSGLKTTFFSGEKRLLFFDWNGTLVDTRGSFEQAFYEVIGDFIGRWSTGDRGEIAARILKVYKAERRRCMRAGVRRKEQVQQLSLRKALEPYPFDVNASFTGSFHTALKKEQENRIRLLPGVHDTLKALKKTYRLAIISNGGGIRLAKIGLSGLIDPADCITSKDAGYRKPRRGIFEYALQQVRKTPAHCIMVGNSWHHDISGAARAGIDAVWIQANAKRNVRRMHAHGRTIAMIRRFPQLMDLL